MLAGQIKDFLSIKIKYRSDGFTDQFNRILIMKMLLVCSSVMGISWFKDSMNCIMPTGATTDHSFLSTACWIQGVYVYTELRNRIDDIAYYGIPKDIENNGLDKDGNLCNTHFKFNQILNRCKPMSKTFFLQYQWMPFFVGAMALCYYLPYLLHLLANDDLISLKKTIRSKETTADVILQTFFDRSTNPKSRLRLRTLYNYIIKVLYVLVNVACFLALDKILLGQFRDYGPKWIRWAKLPNTVAHDYMGLRNFPKPGNEVLPPFGYCELYESVKDIRSSMADKHKVVCELSQNILYQYCLIVLWLLVVLGIIVSLVGLLLLIVDHVVTVVFIFYHGAVARKIYNALSLRECEYLEFIRKRSIPLYGEVIQKLRLETYSDAMSESTPCETPLPAFDDLHKSDSCA